MCELARHDRGFSRVLLDDFLYELYVRAHQARGDVQAMARLAPYLAPPVRADLLSRGRAAIVAVGQVVVGSSQITSLQIRDGRARIRVAYEANYTEVYEGDDKPSARIYAREHWTLVRALSVQSRKPDELHAFSCPSCGAPIEPEYEHACRHCGASNDRGEHEWRCTGAKVGAEVTVAPPLGGYAPEQGNDRPTRRAHSWSFDLAELGTADPQFDLAGFEARVTMIYHRLNAAWTSLQWRDVQPFCTDRFWRSQTYWIDAYRDQHLLNRMDDATVENIEVSKVVRDEYFWAITVRIAARAIDITVHSKTGRIVGGSRSPRRYTEYWTLVRSAARRGAASIDDTCPSCSAPLAIGMTGSCEHCGVKLTGGAFDWVLSKIEQDDVYEL